MKEDCPWQNTEMQDFGARETRIPGNVIPHATIAPLNISEYENSPAK
jgi:hypothetical protein